MVRLIGLWLAGCALCVTPVAADEGVYDGPAAIKPLTVKPQPPHSVPPDTICDFEHQCHPEKGGPHAYHAYRPYHYGRHAHHIYLYPSYDQPTRDREWLWNDP